MRAFISTVMVIFLGLLVGCAKSTTPVQDGQFPQAGQPNATEHAARMISPLTN